MVEEKSLVIYFAPNYLRKALVNFNPESETPLELQEESFLELYSSNSMYSQPSKPFSKREQCNIVDTMRKWIKEIEKDNQNLSSKEQIKVEFITHPLIDSIEGTKFILDSLQAQLGIEVEKFSSKESSRQSFLGIKSNLPNFRPTAKICHVNVCKEHIDLVFGDIHKLDQIIQINFGTQQIAELIASLRKKHDQESLTLFVKANLYRYIEQVKFYGKPHLITFDENTASLISQALSKDLKTQRVNADWIQQLSYKVIDSESQYLNSKADWVSSDALDYVSAHIILVGFLLEGLGTSTCSLDSDSRIKGYILDKQIQNGTFEEENSNHKYDWRRSAHEKLIHLNPKDFSRATQLGILIDKIFDSTQGWLHLWDARTKKILWLSAFFSGSLSQMEPELALKVIKDVEGINLFDCKLITCTVAISCTTNLFGQSKYLDLLPPEHRSVVRKLASIVQIVKALDVTGRSAVQDVKLIAKPKSPDTVILQVTPRLNSSPELIQLNILKKTFENQFDQKLEVEISGLTDEPEEQQSEETDELISN
ncbi:MAG: hypothetical protein QNJ31_01425 [Candidatus Caenarcaniphilales bacterium]|nr:hypothetical protein [Candidatus Caenarcaniphilales bacterium]